MTNPKQASRQLRDLDTWAPLLSDTITTLTSPRVTITTHSHGTGYDLSDLIAPTVDAESDGVAAIRTHAQIVAWATRWATATGITYTGNPLHAIADNTQRLADTWDDWDVFADELAILHGRVAKMTGHSPRTIGPCPETGCTEAVTQAQTRRGAEGPLECPRGHTYKDAADYIEATKASDRHLLQAVTDLGIRVTVAQFLAAWPELTKDDVKNWTRAHGDKPPRLPKDASGRISLAAANLLARRLIEGRVKRNTPMDLPNDKAMM